jgi:phospholipid/cholesterol/gamma-HCH transport system substrate-binding protein
MSDLAKVGLVVSLAALLLTAAVFAIANMHLGGQFADFKTYFKFAGGLEPGAAVRYGGLKVGRVKSVKVDPQDHTRIEVQLEVRADTPMRTDSQANIAQLGLLSENYVEITPGKSGAPLQAGGTIPSAELQDLSALIRKMSGLVDSAQPLITDLHKNLNQISDRADVLLAQLNDITGQENQRHFRSILKETDGMIARNAVKIDKIADNFSSASDELKPLMADLRRTTDKLQKVLDNADGMIGENREQFKKTIADLDQSLVSANALIEQLQTTLTANSDNIDVMLENFRLVSENVREFTDTVKQRPFSLIRIKPLPDRLPPGAPKEAQKKNEKGVAKIQSKPAPVQGGSGR